MTLPVSGRAMGRPGFRRVESICMRRLYHNSYSASSCVTSLQFRRLARPAPPSATNSNRRPPTLLSSARLLTLEQIEFACTAHPANLSPRFMEREMFD